MIDFELVPLDEEELYNHKNNTSQQKINDFESEVGVTKWLLWDILVQSWAITHHELKEALRFQNDQRIQWKNMLLWDILRYQGCVTSQKLISTLETLEIRLRVWEILLKQNKISEFLLDVILWEEFEGKKPILEELIDRKIISHQDMDEILEIQKQYPEITSDENKLLELLNSIKRTK